MPKYAALSIRGLPLGTTAQDVRTHITTRVPDASPVIGPIVGDAQRPALYTSVTIQQDSDNACKAVRDKLNGSRIFPRNPEKPHDSSLLIVSQDFIGVTTVAEHYDPQFDFFFVHGLGGHAAKTWSTDDPGVRPVMWPRDLLPDDAHLNGLAGRFSTIGYIAHALSSYSASTTIQKAAENLLQQISTHRPEGCDRPIYFACHSLGGLVICQALIYALVPNPERAELFESYNKVLSKNGESLVKGIFFFGTPFEGSQIASHASKFVKVLGGNTTLIDSLRSHANDLTEIVAQFNQLRSRPESKIAVSIAFEKQPLYGLKFITKPESAVGVFRDSVHAIGIDGDHKSMIKFPNNQDAGYQTVSRDMIRMIQSTLTGYTPVSPPRSPKDKFSPGSLQRWGTVNSMASTRTAPPQYPGAVPGSSRMGAGLDGDQFGRPPPGNFTGWNPSGSSPDPSQFAHRRAQTELGEPTTRGSLAFARQVPSQDRSHFTPFSHNAARRISGPPRTQTGLSQMETTSTATAPDVNPVPDQEDFVLTAASPAAVNRHDLVALPENSREDNSKFARLKLFDTVFIIDDSGSMNERDGTQVVDAEGQPKTLSRWETLVDGMRYIVDLACYYDNNGVDVHFLYNDAKDELGITEGQRVLDLLAKEVRLDEEGGGTVVGQVLWMVLETHLDGYEDFRKQMRARVSPRPKMPKKLNVIVITDGEAADTEEVEQTIVAAAQKLERLGAPPNQIGIQFLQVGQSETAADWLRMLDDDLHRIHGIKDIVDTRSFDSPKVAGRSFQGKLEQVLLGAISRDIDNTATTGSDGPTSAS